MKKRYQIKIKVAKTLLMFADSEDAARGLIQDYIDEHPDSVETLSVTEVDSFFPKEHYPHAFGCEKFDDGKCSCGYDKE